MYQEKDLVEFYSSVTVNQKINVQQLGSILQQKASENEIPCNVVTESIKFGSLLRSHTEDCLSISHPGHIRDYYSIILHIDNDELRIYRYGYSKQMGKKMEKQQAKKGGGTFVKGFFTGHEPGDGVAGNFVGAGIMMKGTASAIFHGIKALGGNKDELKEEEAWYEALNAIICESVS